MGLWGRLVGYRDDLELEKRWWHRLLKVVFILTALSCLAILIFVLNWVKALAPTTATTRHISLQDFVQQSPRDQVNVIPAFLDLPGHIATLNGSHLERLSRAAVEDIICTADGYRHAAMLAELINGKGYFDAPAQGEPPVYTKDTVIRDLKARGIGAMICYSSEYFGPEMTKIVKYEYMPSARAYHAFKAVTVSSLSVIALCVLVQAFYYRGLVYIICGPRKPKTTASAV